MTDLTLAKSDLTAFLDKLAESRSVWAPAKKNGYVDYRRYDGREIPTEKERTRLSIKGFLLKQREDMLAYTTDPKAINAGIMEEIKPDEPTVVFGVSPCDAPVGPAQRPGLCQRPQQPQSVPLLPGPDGPDRAHRPGLQPALRDLLLPRHRRSSPGRGRLGRAHGRSGRPLSGQGVDSKRRRRPGRNRPGRGPGGRPGRGRPDRQERLGEHGQGIETGPGFGPRPDGPVRAAVVGADRGPLSQLRGVHLHLPDLLLL